MEFKKSNKKMRKIRNCRQIQMSQQMKNQTNILIII